MLTWRGFLMKKIQKKNSANNTLKEINFRVVSENDS